jgi:hypothetical protein
VGGSWGILPELSAGGNSGGVGVFESGASGSADSGPAAGVFILGGDIPDALVKPDRVVENANSVQLGFELARVADLVEVRELGLDVSEQRLDPGLVVGLTG